MSIQSINVEIKDAVLPHMISLPPISDGTKVGAVVLLHPHKSAKYISTYYYEIISSSVKEGWAFVSAFCDQPDKLVSLFTRVRSQPWSNKVIIAIGTPSFNILRFLQRENRSKNLGPDYIFLFHNVQERWWHTTEDLNLPNLTQSLKLLHTQMENVVEHELGSTHEFLEWLRCLNPAYHQISIRDLRCLPPLYVMSGWMNSRVDSVIDLMDKSVMTIIGPWKKLTGKSLNAALRDWLKFTMKGNSAPKSQSRFGSPGGIYVVPTPSTRWHEGYYGLDPPVNLKETTVNHPPTTQRITNIIHQIEADKRQSPGRATYRWKKIDLPWGLVNGCVELGLQTDLAAIRENMQNCKSGWEGIIQLEGRVGVWGRPRLRMRIGTPSSTTRTLAIRKMVDQGSSTPPQSSRPLSRTPSLTSRRLSIIAPLHISSPVSQSPSLETLALRVLGPEPLHPIPKLDQSTNNTAPTTLISTDIVCLCAQLYTNKGELLSYGFAKIDHNIVEIDMKPFFLSPISGLTRETTHESRTTNSNPKLQAQKTVIDPDLHGLHLFLSQSWLPSVYPGINQNILHLREMVLELPLVVKDQCKVSNILLPEEDLKVMPSRPSVVYTNDRLNIDVTTYESQLSGSKINKLGTINASFGNHGDFTIKITDQRNECTLVSTIQRDARPNVNEFKQSIEPVVSTSLQYISTPQSTTASTATPQSTTSSTATPQSAISSTTTPSSGSTLSPLTLGGSPPVSPTVSVTLSSPKDGSISTILLPGRSSSLGLPSSPSVQFHT
jgi:hypothetical protein